MNLASTYQQVLENMRQIIGLRNTVGSEYASNKEYSVGDYCYYNNLLYKCITNIESPGENWNPNHWLQVIVVDEIEDVAADVKETEESTYDIKNMIASEYNPPYSAGDYCIYNNNLYKCISDIPEGSQWSSSEWVAVILTNEFSDLKNVFDFISDGTHSNDSPIVVDESTNSIKVIGVHINSTNVNTETGPSNYTTGVTYEIKNTNVLFGDELPEGITGAYCILITYVLDSRISTDTAISGTEIKPFQIVYCNTTGGYYKRMANTSVSTFWNNWVYSEITRTLEEMVIVNNTQPATGIQKTGEFWYSKI